MSETGSIRFDLPASKSLSNRALIIQALAQPGSIELHNLSSAQDTQTLLRLLAEAQPGAVLDCGPAGTTFRFLCAWLSTRAGSYTLTGSPRMLERPIGALVDALRQLGAGIRYLDKEGFPPLEITGFAGEAKRDDASAAEVLIDASISSQFLSALLLIAPVLPKGLNLRWEGHLVSKPYLDMTLQMMGHFGAGFRQNQQEVWVSPGGYQAGNLKIEADWSAASYFAAKLALASKGSIIYLEGLSANSLQGDRKALEWLEEWGVAAQFDQEGLLLSRHTDTTPAYWEADFDSCPDLAQTFSVLCAATGTTALFTGLETLRVKETDRIAALRDQLSKAGVHLSKLPAHFRPSKAGEMHMQEGKAAWEGELFIQTYHDHRMAMAFAIWDALGSIRFEDPQVVQKSFPQFWEEWSKWQKTAA